MVVILQFPGYLLGTVLCNSCPISNVQRKTYAEYDDCLFDLQMIALWPVTYETARQQSHELVTTTVENARALVKKSLSTGKYFVRLDDLQEQIKVVSDVYLQAANSSDPLRVSLLDGMSRLVCMLMMMILMLSSVGRSCEYLQCF